jgi:hypothetical protein
MINEETLLQVINDFEEHPNYKFSIKEYKSFIGPENKEMIYIILQLEEYSYSTENFNSKLFEIKKRIKNILSFDRVIINCDLKSDLF